MNNYKPIPFGRECPKCQAKLQGGTKFCEKINECKTWRIFGGEHLHILCANCKFLRTTRCADLDEEIPSIEQINKWLDAYIEQHNIESIDEIQFDFE